MAEIHPSAIIEGEVDLADDVVIGPGCVIRGTVSIGSGTQLLGSAYVQGPLRMGTGNRVYPFCGLGFAPQSTGYDPDRPGEGVEIGDGNTFREGVTIHRAMTDEGPTRLGDRNFLMVNSHVGHDCRVANDCIFANAIALGGHVHAQDRVTLGGNTVVHQFCQLGRGAMLSGGAAASRDLPPFFMLTGITVVGSINLVGMRRMGMSAEDIADVRWVYRTLYRAGLALTAAKKALAARAARPLVAEYLEFLSQSTRGICTAQAKPVRSTTGVGTEGDSGADESA